MADDSKRHPDCFGCQHLEITWERGRAYACRGVGFKSQEIPWRVVLATSGQPCLLFRPKPKRGPGSGA